MKRRKHCPVCMKDKSKPKLCAMHLQDYQCAKAVIFGTKVITLEESNEIIAHLMRTA